MLSHRAVQSCVREVKGPDVGRFGCFNPGMFAGSALSIYICVAIFEKPFGVLRLSCVNIWDKTATHFQICIAND